MKGDGLFPTHPVPHRQDEGPAACRGVRERKEPTRANPEVPQRAACTWAGAGRTQERRQPGHTEPPACACLLHLLLNHFMYTTTEVSLVT